MALSGTQVLFGQTIMNVETGATTSVADFYLADGVYESPGAVFISTSCSSSGTTARLCKLDPMGVVTELLPDTFTRRALSPLRVSPSFIVVLGPDTIWSIRRNSPAKVQVLDAYDVSLVTLRNTTLYFAGSTSTGVRGLGRLDLDTGAITTIATNFEAIKLEAVTP